MPKAHCLICEIIDYYVLAVCSDRHLFFSPKNLSSPDIGSLFRREAVYMAWMVHIGWLPFRLHRAGTKRKMRIDFSSLPKYLIRLHRII